MSSIEWAAGAEGSISVGAEIYRGLRLEFEKNDGGVVGWWGGGVAGWEGGRRTQV